MSKVFIAWSGNFEIAQKLRDKVNMRPGYEAIVGGNANGIKNIYVGGTIIEQMKGCDQAILLIQKNEAHGGLSPNVMFEWGYLLAKLNPNKMHHYLIDDPQIPSDLSGVWAYGLSSEGKTADGIAEELAEQFFSSQRNSLTKNKMKVIIDRDETRNVITKHCENPVSSNYEMAQYVFCYIFSAVIYADTRDEALRDMEKFYSSLDEHALQSEELLLAVRCAIITMGFLKKVNYAGDEQSVPKDVFYSVRESYEELSDQVEDLAESEVKTALQVAISDFIAFAYLLVINGGELDDDKKRTYCNRLYEYSAYTVEACNRLESCSPKLNVQLMRLVRAYMYRDMFCALDCLERIESEEGAERTAPQEERLKLIKENLFNSLEERKKLYNEYSVSNVNAQFMSNIEMEYYLALAEYRLYEDDYRQRERIKEKLLRYIRNADRQAEQRRVFTEKIRGYAEK